MAWDQSAHDVSIPASGDLSTKQYLFQTVNSSGQAATATRGADSVGVLQNAPAASGRPARLRVGGISKVIYGGNVTAGQNVTSDSSGQAVHATSSDNYIMGIALVTGVSGDVGEMIVQPRGLS